ncbi:MAG: hypothetical protein A2Y12_05500 [Planctomycetes bacterium GWF2_42_9]|nr:MAG: hypothetical protein A2Y12_05500 [Planctomycetes bacterium GWF2_42_9]
MSKTQDELAVGQSLTAKQQMFVELYSNPESECYDNGKAAAEKADYNDPGNSAWRLKQSPNIREAIQALQKEYQLRNGLTADSVISDLQFLKRRALDKNDLATATRCVELMGKSISLFSDGLAVRDTSKEQIKLNEAQQREAHILADIRLKGGYDDTPPFTPNPPGA